MCMYQCLHVCLACLVPKEARRGVRSPSARVMGNCDLPHGCWELNPDPLQEQLVLLPLSHLPPG